MQLIKRKTRDIGDGFLKECRDRKLSPKTLEGYVLHIKRLVALSKWFPPKPEIVQQCLGDFTGILNADSHYRTWHALGNYAKRRYRTPNFMDKIIRPKAERQIMPTISENELNRLAIVLQTASPRDRAIITLFVDTAIRSGEAANLKREHILEDRLVLKGKTGFRVAPLSSITRELLLSLPAHNDRYVFHGTGKCKDKPLGSTGFYKIVRGYLLKAGYQGNKQFGTQILRRSFGRFHLLDGGDMKSLSLILGHKSVKTTDDYYSPLLTEDVIRIHHRHTPGRVFENTANLEKGVINDIDDIEKVSVAKQY